MLEATESFTAGLSNISGGLVTIADTTGIASISDNDAASVAIAGVSVDEDAGEAIFTITLSGNVQDAFSVDVSTASGTALAGSDYTSGSATLTFSGDKLQDQDTIHFAVAITDDSLLEATESFTAGLSNISGGLVTIADTTAIASISDNDAASVAIAGVNVDEDAGEAIFTITLSGNVQDAFSVDVSTASGTALAGSDYTSGSATLTFSGDKLQDQDTIHFAVAITDDSLLEATESFTAGLSNISGGLVTIADTTAIASISDNDAASVAIAGVNVDEDAGEAIFTITLSGNVQDAFSVDVSTASGTALAGSDYTSGSATLTFSGDKLQDQDTIHFAVAITDDSLLEATESFTAGLSNISGGLVTIADTTAIASISDNDAASVAIAGVSVDEDAGEAIFTITLSGNVQDAFSVDVSTASGTALAGSDYTSGSATLTFSGDKLQDQDTIHFAVAITDDSLLEATESFTAGLSNISGGLVTIADTTAIASISDNDAASVAIAGVNVDEDAGEAIFTITLSGNVQDAFSVDVSTASGTALAGSDYTSGSATLTFSGDKLQDQDTIHFAVAITDDSLLEATESFTAGLSNISGGLVTIADTTAIASISDNDAASVAIAGVNVDEDAGEAIFTITLSGNVQDAFSVDVSTASGTALAGSDYTSGSATLTFSGDKLQDQDTIHFAVAITDDSLLEATESFTAGLSNISGGLVTIADTTGIASISDNDAASVAIAGVNVDEDAGEAIFTITLSGNVQDAFSVDVSTASGTALAGSDYTSGSATLTFSGDKLQDQDTIHFAVAITDDSLLEATESFTAGLSNISGGLVTIADTTGIASISDNDAASVAIAGVNVDEDAGEAIFTITLSGNVQDAFSVDVSTASGTALAGSDYTSGSATLTFSGDKLQDQDTIHFAVAITDDSLLEATESFTAGLSNISGGLVTIADTTAIASISDNDAASVAIAGVSVDEDAGEAIFTITLSGNVQDAFSVDVSTASGTALAGSDYTSGSATLTFSGDKLQDQDTIHFAVAITDDSLLEATESFTAGLSNISGGLVTIADTTAIASISDNDAASVAIAGVNVDEDAGEAIFTITLSGNVQDAFSVDVSTASGTALAGSDYTSGSATLTFSGDKLQDQDTIHFAVAITDDSLLEATESFTAGLSNISGGLVTIADTTAIASISDNDAASVAIAGVSVDEDAGEAIFTITLSGNVQDAFSVDVSTASGTALAGSDYTSGSATLTFSGDKLQDQDTIHFAVAITDDSLLEATESFTAGLSNISGGLVTIADTTAIASISDNDAASVAIAGVNVDEDAGEAIFTITLSGNVQDAFSVDVSTASGTALAGSDYTSGSATLTFSGDKLQDQDTIHFAVAITDDSLLEATESFTAGLSNISGGLVTIADTTATASINDNDAASVAIAGVSVDEDAGEAIFTITLSGNVQDAFSVDVSTASGTALAGSDYTSGSATLTFSGDKLQDQDTIHFAVAITDDSLLEATESFTAGLSNISGGLVTIADTTATASINDNDAASVAIAGVSVDEDAGEAIFTITLSGNVQDAFSVDVSTASGTALAGSDYTSGSATLTFSGDKLQDQDTIHFAVAITDDSLLEATESFTAGLSNISGGLVTIADTTAIASISDNDAASVAIAGVNVDEDAGEAIFTITLSGNVQDAFSVDVSTASGTALGGSDYTSGSATLTFSGDKLQDQDTIHFAVAITDDSLLEATESFTAGLSNISGGLVTIADTTAIASINDNDAASVAIAGVSVDEDAGEAIFTITLSGNVQDAFSVDVSTASGTALAGSDYTSGSATLTFSGDKLQDQDTIHFAVAITDDSLLEATESFTAGLSNISGGLVTIADTTAIASISDNDAASVAIAGVNVDEDAGEAIFTITLSGNVQDAFSVDVSTASGTALGGSDYTSGSATLTFSGDKLQDQDTIHFAVAITDDSLLEATESFTAGLSNISGGLVTIADTTAIASINDNDAASVAIAGVSVDEDAGEAIFTITLSGNVQDAFSVDVSTASGTALAGSDYTSGSATLTFSGDKLQDQDTIHFAVAITDDSLLEATESFTAGLSNISGGLVTIADTTAIASISDNDAASVAIAGVNVDEDAGEAIFTITLSGNVQDAFSVDVSTASGTALGGSDYTSGSATLTFSGDKLQDQDTIHFAVAITDDSLLEATESFTAGLSNISGGLVTIADTTAIASINDNDAASVAIAGVSVDEDAGEAIFTITLSGNVQDAFSVDVSTASGTALAGSDYTSGSATLTFSGDKLQDQDTIHFAVAITDDSLLEATESFTAGLSNISGGLVTIADTTGIASISDNDAASVAIAGVNVDEDAGEAIFTITLSGNVQDAFSVDVSTASGTALAGSDYTSGSATLTFSGDKLQDQDTIHFAVAITDDSLLEATESFTAGLSNISGGLVTIADTTAIASINDNDAASVAIAGVSVDEDAGEAIFTITLSGNVQDAFSVDVSTASGTALAGSDYTSGSATLTFSGDKLQDQDTIHFAVAITDDSLLEATESFTAGLSNISGGLVTIADTTGIASISDNDAASVAIAGVSVDEDAGEAIFTITLSGNVQDAFSVDVSTASGTALAGSDYTSGSATLTFSGDKLQDQDTIHFAVAITDDSLLEATESFTAGLSNISGGLVTIADTTATASINDNDAASVAIAGVNVDEDAGEAIFTITLSGNVQDAFSVDVSTASGTALAGSDYTSGSATLTFSGDKLQDQDTIHFAVAITDDSLLEATESFTAGLSNISGGLVTIADTTAIASISDNDAASVAIAGVNVDEDAGEAIFTITLSGNVQDAFSVDVSTASGTALAGSDYTSGSATLTFSGDKLQDQDTIHFAVAITDDSLLEATESFTAGLSNISGGLVTIADTTAIASISDNDAASVAIAGVSVDEDAGEAIFTITLSGNVQDAFSVDVSTASGTALAGSDYTSGSATLTFSGDKLQDQDTIHFAVAITDDSLLEATESFTAGLSNISGGLVTIADTTAIASISDNDAASVAIAGVSVDEDAGEAIFTITLSGNVQDAFSVDVSTASGTALAGSDYTSGSATLTFSGDKLQDQDTIHFAVAITDDSLLEATESFTAGLSNISGGLVTIADTTAIASINDNDAASVAIAGVNVDEDAGEAIFTITLSGNVQDAFSVGYSVNDSTTVLNSDYTLADTMTAYFPDNSLDGATQTITVNIVDDLFAEPTEYFIVELLKTEDALIDFTDSIAIGSITDDDEANISIENITVNESDGEAVVIVRLSGAVQDEVTAGYTLSNGSAVQTEDYQFIEGTITISAGSTTNTTVSISIPVINDGVVESDEYFNVTISNLVATSKQVTISKAEAKVTILNDDYAPLAGDIEISGLEDEWLTFSESLFATAFSDKNNDNLSEIKMMSLPDNGNLFLSGMQVQQGQRISAEDLSKLIFKPDSNWNGTTAFSYIVSDGWNWSAKEAEVSILVESVNDDPIAVDDIINSLEDKQVFVNVLENDSDVENDTLIVIGLTVNGINYLPGNLIGLEGKGTLIIEENGEFTFTPDENYNGNPGTISYTISDGNGGEASAEIKITVYEDNDAPRVYHETFEMCYGLTLEANILANGDYDVEGHDLSVANFDAGTITVGDFSITENGAFVFVPGDDFAGKLIIPIQVCDPDGRCVTDTLTIIVHQSFELEAGEPLLSCGGGEVALLQATASDNVSIEWQTLGDGSFTDPQELNAAYLPGEGDLAAGNVQLILTGRGNSTCPEKSDTVLVSFAEEVHIFAGNDSSVCSNQAIALSASVIPEGMPVKWETNGDGNFDDATVLDAVYNPGVNDILAGMAELYVMAETNGSCGKTQDTVLILIEEAPVLSAGESRVACVNSPVTVETASAENVAEVHWISNGKGSLLGEYTLTPTYEPAANDDAIVMLILTGTGSGACEIQVSDTMFIEYNTSLQVSISGDDTITAGSSAVLSANVLPEDGNYEYLWSPNELLDMNQSMDVFTQPLNASTEFVVQVSDLISGCVVSDSFMVVVIPASATELNIRNGITPNGDGNNDVWYIEGIEYFPDNRVTIYNRWGDELISIENYHNDYNNWDGRNRKGEYLPDGTYYYLLEIEGGENYTGWIQLRTGK